MPSREQQDLLDVFVYTLISAPDRFPSENGASLDSEFDELREGIGRCLRKCRALGIRRLYRLSQIELEQAYLKYKDGNEREGRRLLQNSHRHFQDAVFKRNVGVSFIAGPEGVRRNDDG